jgi:hypothetical protein
MKIRSALLLLAALLLPAATHAEEQAAPQSFEEKAVHAFLLYCLPALSVGDSVARVAEMDKLPRLPAIAEKAFLQGRPGKVFALPKVGNDVVLVAPAMALCSIDVKKMDVAEFDKQTTAWFTAKEAPFKLIKDESSLKEISRQYQGKVGDANILILVSARYKVTAGQLQGIITAGRTTGKP